MILCKVLASGNFLPEDLQVSVSASNRKTSLIEEGQIESVWQVKLNDAKDKGKNCYNGLCYRLNSIACDGKTLTLDFGIVDFKTWISLQNIPSYFDLPEEYFVNGCHSLATVKTSDDKYLMVELSGKSMNLNKVDFLGGTMEANEDFSSGNDLFRSFYHELHEEGLIDQPDIVQAKLKLVYRNPKTHIGFYFEVILKITADELIARFNESGSDPDIRSLKAFSRAEYLETLKKHNANKQFIATVVEI